MITFEEARKNGIRCEKCKTGFHSQGPTYHTAQSTAALIDSAVIPEHMEWACNHCGHALWSECAK